MLWKMSQCVVLWDFVQRRRMLIYDTECHDRAENSNLLNDVECDCVSFLHEHQ